MSEGLQAVLIGVFGLIFLVLVAMGLGAITPKATGSYSECGSASWKYDC